MLFPKNPAKLIAKPVAAVFLARALAGKREIHKKFLDKTYLVGRQCGRGHNDRF